MISREELQARDPDLVFFSNYDDAIIGTCERIGQETIIAYDYDKIIEILVAGGMTEEDAVDYFHFNISGAFLGDRTPCFITLGEKNAA